MIDERLGCEDRDTLIRVQTLLDGLRSLLNAPGDWGYETDLGEFTVATLNLLHKVRRQLHEIDLAGLAEATGALSEGDRAEAKGADAPARLLREGK